ncbi:MAG: NBR1-Ig-like domain-containing protein [Chloroflexota bacterium]
MRSIGKIWMVAIVLLVMSSCSAGVEEEAVSPTAVSNPATSLTDETSDEVEELVEPTVAPTSVATVIEEETAVEPDPDTTNATQANSLDQSASFDQSYSYEGVSFQYSSELTTAVRGEKVPATTGTYSLPPDGPPLFYNGVPDFLRLIFDDDGLSVHPPLLVVQPIRDEGGAVYSTYSEWDQERFDLLEQQFQTQLAPATASLNNQPLAQASYLSFQNGTGLRQVTHIPGGMGLVDVNNSNVFYTYEGMTANGRYLIWLQFPVTAPVLTDEPMALEDLENLYRSENAYSTYFQNKMEQLDSLAPADFSPSLDTIDQMITSLFVPDDASTVTSLPLNDPDCSNDGAFVADVTIPDGSSVAARSTFIKTWRVRNSGSCIWTAAYELVPDGSGPIAYVFGERPFGVVAPGEEVDISVELIAPALAGNYRADFQLFEPFDINNNNFPEPFGPRIYVEIVVPESGQPDPPPQGNWQIYSYTFAEGTAVTEDQANAQVGNILTLAPDSISFADQSCSGVAYSSRYVDPANYLTQTYQATAETLYISDENVDVIQTGCSLPGLGEIMRLATIHNETLVFNQDGVFYFLYEQ